MVMAPAHSQLSISKANAPRPCRPKSCRQPKPMLASHSIAVGSGSQAQDGERPGTLIWKTE